AEADGRGDANARRAIRSARLSRLRTQARRAFRARAGDARRRPVATIEPGARREVEAHPRHTQADAARASEGRQTMSTDKAAGGLRGVSAGQTAIATVGDGHGLRYRGYDVVELAAHATFEEVAYLLLRGELPSARELDAFRATLRARRDLPRALCE